ncbi:protein dispatched [Sitodiplosis mosellana]|uniref:protein dispatched n=1 Tax=Sitodiplosis mosellana TaxID=263140 RepID=UPI00244374DB|nr:protein dispatched [Sitodiplosis mosellana]
MMHWYYKLLALHPRWVAFVVLILSSVCIFIAVTFKELPDFTDPALGFESRGTDISNRLTAWHNLLEETRPSGRLTSNFYDQIVYRENFARPTKRPKHGDGHHKKRKMAKSLAGKNVTTSGSANVLDELSVNEESSDRPMKKGGKNKRKKMERPNDVYFCDAPNREYTHMVLVRSNGNASLLEMDALRAVCDLESKLTTVGSYKGFCQMKTYSKECCRPWSIPNYIAFLANKTSCSDIQENDLLEMSQLLRDCYKYYLNGSLRSDCENSKCLVPVKCAQSNAAYQILHFLTDNKFNETNPLFSTMIFLPMAKTTKILPYYYDILSVIHDNDVLSVAAINMGLKNSLFDELLFYDGWLIALGAMCILYCILIYTNSILITLSTVVANILSIGVAYFIYQVVLQLPYFPFMNLLAIIIIVGIGADDCFVYMKEWRLSADEWEMVTSKHLPKRKSKKLIFLVSNTMEHAAKSIFVTSLTTAHAFLASYSSSITAIRCFGLYAAIVIMVNYVLMVTWLPATVIIVEELNLKLCKCWQSYVDAINVLIERFGNSMEAAIIRLVKEYKYVFLVIFFIIGISSGFIVLYYPKLGLPDSQTFQLLDSEHLFELYDSKYRHLYRFERSFTEAETFKMPIRFVFGVEAVDDGNHLIPSSKGTLHLGKSLNLSSAETQLWLLDFCKKLKQQSFYQPNNMPAILPSCFIENLIDNMNKRCFDPMTNSSRMPCCEEEKFPYKPEVFEKCLPEMISSLYSSPRYIFVPGVSGPKFERKSSFDSNETQNRASIRALVMEYESTQPFSTSYTEMSNFSANIDNWFNDMLKNAPEALKNGWFTSELGFYDLQGTLSSGTLIAATIAMISSLIALLLFTMNVLVSLYAVLTVIFTILSTMAVLVLLEWKLNILESIAVNTAIGLGIDFVLHYALNYQMSEKKDRQSATEYSLSHMIGPTLMAAFTTIIAGLCIVFSSVLAYIQIGIFLLIVMTVSWFYATFFFCTLLYTIGPIGGEKQTSDRTNPNDVQAMQQLNNMVKQNARKPTHLNKTETDTLT